MRTFGMILAAAFTCGACGASDSPDAAKTPKSPEDTASSHMAPLANGEDTANNDPNSHSDGETAATDVQPRSDLIGETMQPWSRYEQVSEDQLRFFVTTGTPYCYGVRYDLVETADTVQVATFTGELSDGPQTCTAEAVEVSVLVSTEQPIGDRAIIHPENPT